MFQLKKKTDYLHEMNAMSKDGFRILPLLPANTCNYYSQEIH